MPLEGTLREFNLFEVLSLLKVAGKTGKLVITLDNGKSGEIYITDGKPVHAIFGNNIGENALLKMVKEKNGTFLFTLGAVTSEKTIMSDTEELISRIEEKEKELQLLISQIGDINKYIAFNKDIPDMITLNKDEWQFLTVAFSGKPIYAIAEEYEKGEIEAYKIINSLLEKGAIKVSDKPTIMSLEGEAISIQSKPSISSHPTSQTTTIPSHTASKKLETPNNIQSKVSTTTPNNISTKREIPLTRSLKAKVKLKAYMSTTGTEVCWIDSTILKEWQELLGSPVTMVEIQAASGKKSKVPVKSEDGIGETIYLLPITSFRLRLSDEDIVQVTPIKS